MEFTTCSDSLPNVLNFIDTTIAHPLLFYSYIPVIVISLFLGTYVLIKDRFSIKSKFLFAISVAFVLWTLNELSQWLVVYNEIVMFSWEMSAIFGVALFYFSLLFIQALVRGKLSNWNNSIIILSVIPIFIFLPTSYNIGAYDLTNCEGTDFGWLWIYIYILEASITAVIIYLGLSQYWNKKKGTGDRNKSLLATLAITAFLALFSFSGIISDLTGWYTLTFLGPLGMVIFLGLLSYMMVRFHTFKAKVFGAQVLVAVLWILVGSILLVAKSEITRIIVAITEIIAIIFGLMLIGSVKKEIKQKEEIAQLAKNLQSANDKLKELDQQKSEFLSFATHQLRSPITAIKGYASMLLEGSFGELGEKSRGAVDVIYQSSQKLVLVIEDFLNISRIELGRMQYEFAETNLTNLVRGIADQMRPIAESRHIALVTKFDAEGECLATIDSGKISQVVSNLVDNAIKYTPQGSVTLGLVEQEKTVKIEIKDTGVGIDKQTMERLFQKFSRAYDASRLNTEGTGLGLYVARQLVEAHGGKLWAESEGKDKGTTFVVELPVQPSAARRKTVAVK